ncbi:uncharacterized protein LAESUDRAFT_602594, partial [Laetiporus sulphureus 93-53]
LPQLPIEIWERTIDHLWNSPPTLLSCSLVCKSWCYRSRFHLVKRLVLHTRKAVRQCAHMVKEHPILKPRVMTSIFETHPSHIECRPVAQLGTFATMFAGRLPHVKVMAIWHVEWQSGEMHEGIFLHLSAFTSVVRLQLADVKFPNLLVFGRIIYALPNLEEFSYNQLSFTNETFD